MKFQPKRFVVEVKRGTSRSAFASPDASADRFSSAEAMLFGGSPKAEAQPASVRDAGPAGRVLRSLVEPEPPVADDPPVRRGRKPGSKNKPKLETEVDAEVPSERPRRGRKPGSKNKPKAPAPSSYPTVDSPYDVAAAMRSYGFAEDGTVAGTAPPRPAFVAPTPSAAVVEPAAAQAGPVRLRLRERSTILKRYVLDLEPLPGQRGASRLRRLARAAR